ncbi:MAG: hypothetical protein LUF26_04800 [Firmicutes bacterium]|nr:hypothetical protein [Bacillota bacterium]
MNIKRKVLALLTALTLALSSAAPFAVLAADEETAPEITVIEAAAPEPEEITEAEEPEEESPEEVNAAVELFAADGDTEQSSEHVASVELSDGTTYYYTTLAAAVTYASGITGTVTTTITLLSDITLTDKVTITNTTNTLKNYLVLDLNGKTITGNVTDDYALYLGASNNNGYVTVKNGTINAGDSAYGAIQIDGEYVQLDTLTLTSKTAGHGTVLVNAVKGNNTAPSTFTDLTINTVDGACMETAAGTVANTNYLYMDGTNTFTQTMSNGTQASADNKSAALYLGDCSTVLYVRSTATLNWTSEGYGVYFAGGNSKLPKVYIYGGGKISGELGGVYIGSEITSTLSFCVYAGSTIAVYGGLTSEATSLSNGGYTIYAGTYEYDLDSSYIPSGYACELDTDTTSDTYGLYVINEVILAEVYNGSTLVGQYNSLSGAITAANAGYTVKLVKDINIVSSITISKNITIDMNGFNITYSRAATSNYVFNLNTSGSKNTLTLTNSKLTGGVITNASNNSDADCVAFISRGHLVVEDGVSLYSVN